MTLLRRRWVLLLLVALAARAITFGNPLMHADEQFYFVVAKAMWAGQLPYVDLWDRKPLGLFLLYMPAALLPLPWGTLAYQALALAFVVGTAALVARFADRVGWGAGALAAGCAYILWLGVMNGPSGQSPVFYNLPVAAAAWLTVTRAADRRAGLLAMTLMGLALQIKPAAVFEGMLFGLWLLAAEWRARRSLPALLAYAGAMMTLAALPTALSWSFYAAQGHAASWWQANVTAVLGRRPDSPLWQVRNAARLLLLLSALLAMAGASRHEPAEDRATRAFLFAWLLVAVGGVVLFGGWYDHYGLPIALPASACAAGFLGGRGRRWAAPILLTAALAGQIKAGTDIWKHGGLADLRRLVAAVGPGPGTLFVYSGETLLYPETARRPLSRYIFPSHFFLAREEESIGVMQADELRRILAQRPDVIVMTPKYKSEEAHIRAVVIQVVAHEYRRVATVPVGQGLAYVYRRR